MPGFSDLNGHAVQLIATVAFLLCAPLFSTMREDFKLSFSQDCPDQLRLQKSGLILPKGLISLAFGLSYNITHIILLREGVFYTSRLTLIKT
ncbi:hypothetical protein V1514DRAFT_217493 [Lipomyces japonicus]|uniref:uncharacterized protein n=1 Tax=Lipomyces japonicus TaxID=56871 RepID=UPI0034CF65C3